MADTRDRWYSWQKDEKTFTWGYLRPEMEDAPEAIAWFHTMGEAKRDAAKRQLVANLKPAAARSSESTTGNLFDEER